MCLSEMGERALAATSKFALENLKNFAMEKIEDHGRVGIDALVIRKTLLKDSKTVVLEE